MARPLFPDREALEALCRRHHVRRFSLFGSTLRGTNRSDSDVDLLVEFEPGTRIGLLGLAGMEIELSEMLGAGGWICAPRGDLSRYFRDEVVRTADVQCAAR